MRPNQHPGLGPMANSLRRNRRRGNGPLIVFLLLLVAGGGTALWMWLQSGTEETTQVPAEAPSVPRLPRSLCPRISASP